LVNICKEFDDLMNIFDAIAAFGNKFCHEYIAREKFFQGLNLIRDAAYTEQSYAIRNCFSFVGVGGKKAIEYSRKRFEEIFDENERCSVMHFLDKYGRIPFTYMAEDEEEFRKQAKERIKEEK